MSQRLQNLELLKSHPMIGKDFTRLSKAELDEVMTFIKKTAAMDDNAYMLACNRFKLDEPKSKRYPIQWSILIQCVDTMKNFKRRT